MSKMKDTIQADDVQTLFSRFGDSDYFELQWPADTACQALSRNLLQRVKLNAAAPVPAVAGRIMAPRRLPKKPALPSQPQPPVLAPVLTAGPQFSLPSTVAAQPKSAVVSFSAARHSVSQQRKTVLDGTHAIQHTELPAAQRAKPVSPANTDGELKEFFSAFLSREEPSHLDDSLEQDMALLRRLK